MPTKPGAIVRAPALLAALVLAATLGLPTAAAAGFQPSVDVRHFEFPAVTINTDTGAFGDHTFNLIDAHDLPILNRTTVFVVSASYQTDSSVVTGEVVQFQLVVDDVNIQDCVWRQAGGTLISETSSSLHLRCHNSITGLEPGVHTVRVDASVIQGGNPIENGTTTVTIIQTEVVELSTNFEEAVGLTGNELIALLLLGLLGVALAVHPRATGVLRFSAGILGAAVAFASFAADPPFNMLGAVYGIVVIVAAIVTAARGPTEEKTESVTV